MSHGGHRRGTATTARLTVATLAVVLFATACGDRVVPPQERSVTVSTAGCGYATEAISSGVVVGDGLVLTAAHGVRGSSSVDVTAVDGATRPATIVGLDMRRDLALLSVTEFDAPALELAHAAAGDVGRIVGSSASGTIPYLVRRAVDITIDRIGGEGGHERVGYELEATSRTGDSGAGAYDDQGRLIGIVFATSDDGTGATWITASSEVGGFLTDDLTGPWVCDPDESRIVPAG